MFGKNMTYSASGGLDGGEILLNHPDLLSGHYPPVPDLYANQDLVHGLAEPAAEPEQPAPRASKKDRHSKINTAQGPRDRRVRLSIGVARKFFDLQEMLGFDKPSKTLDWLLTKSKSAIKHLVQTKSSLVSTLSAECEENNNANPRKKEKSVLCKKKKRAKDSDNHEALSLAKESRAKARARARERTREKMCIKQQQQQQHQQRINETNGYDLIPIQYQDYHQEELIQGSIVGKRRVVKHSNNNSNPSIFEFQTSYGIPSSSYSENWDISNYAAQSSICAILDQHKFNHSSSNN